MGYLGYLIAGGAVMSGGGSFIMLGLLYPKIFPSLNRIWYGFLWAGIISLIIGGILLITGLVQRSHRFDKYK